MRTVLVFFLIGICCLTYGIESVSAASVTGTAPRIQTGIPLLDDELDRVIGLAFNSAIAEANDSLGRYSNQEDLARGFGNANAFSSHASGFLGFHNYSRMTVSTGVMAGLQAPSTDPDYYDNIEDDIEEEGDLYAGVGAAVSFLNVGLNANSYYPGLYVNFKFGTLSLDPTDDITVSSTIIGVGANYALRKPLPGTPLFRWRGLSLGTGLIYHSSKVTLGLDLAGEIDVENFSAIVFGDTVSGSIEIDPSILLELRSRTLTIPFDITTGAQVLSLFNFAFGAGIDVNLGKTDIIIVGDGTVNVNLDNVPMVGQSTTPGTVIIDGSTEGISPSFARMRFMGGLGFNFGPVKLEIPVMYYMGAGASAGITLGVVL